MKNKQLILDKIAELEKRNISIMEAEIELFNYLIKAMPDDIQEAHDKMVINKIPF